MERVKVQAQDLVAARLYNSVEEVHQDGLRHLLQNRPDLRIAIAVHQYQSDEELTLARAAALASSRVAGPGLSC